MVLKAFCRPMIVLCTQTPGSGKAAIRIQVAAACGTKGEPRPANQLLIAIELGFSEPIRSQMGYSVHLNDQSGKGSRWHRFVHWGVDPRGTSKHPAMQVVNPKIKCN